MDPDFWVRGEDGQDYGPVLLGELKVWRMEDRVGTGTLVSRDSAEGPWVPWETVPELRALDHPMVEAPAPMARLGAFVLDTLYVLLGASTCLTLAVSAVPVDFVLDAGAALDNLRQGLPPSFEQKFVEFVFLLTQFVYFTYYHGRHARTPGKRVFGLRVVSLRREVLTWPQCALRSLAMLLSSMPFYFGFLFAFIHPDQRSFHDLLAGTRVIRSGSE